MMVPQELNATDDFDARLDGVSVYQISQHRRTTDTPLDSSAGTFKDQCQNQFPDRTHADAPLTLLCAGRPQHAPPLRGRSAPRIDVGRYRSPSMVSFVETGSNRVECGYVNWTLARLLRRH